HVMLGDYRAAVVDAEAALGHKPTTPEMMHNIACIFAQAVAAARNDQRTADRQSLAKSYRARALSAVRDTLAMLPLEQRASFWHDKILPDAALAPIRNDEEFKRLGKQESEIRGQESGVRGQKN